MSGVDRSLLEFVRKSTLKAAEIATQERFASLALRLQTIADGEIERIQAAGPPPACRKGCAYCCHRLVEATLPEIASIQKEVESWSEQERESLQVRLAEHQTNARAYWEGAEMNMTLPCPFLVGDACSIYEQRPLSCRGKSSFDASACLARSHVPVVPGQAEVVETISRAQISALSQAGRDSGAYDLAATMLDLTRDPSLLSKAAAGDGAFARHKLVSEHDIGALIPARPMAELFEIEGFRSYLEQSQDGYVAEALETLKSVTPERARVLGGLRLPMAYSSEEEIDEWWERLGMAVARLESSRVDAREAFACIPVMSLLAVAYSGKNVRPTMGRVMTQLHRFALEALPSFCQPIEGARRAGKLRIGFVSYRLTQFNGSRWAIGWLRNFGPEVETFAYHLGASEDAVSLRWRHFADHYHHLPYHLPEAAELIKAHDLDALIFTDIGMDGVNLQLSLLRLARAQMAAWGHPVTSGSPNIDFYLSSALMEPENCEDHYSEKVVRLPGSGLTYPRWQKISSLRTASSLGVPEGGFYFCAQNLSKLLPRHDALYAEICRCTGKPIVFLGSPFPEVSRVIQDRLIGSGVQAIFLDWLSMQDFYRAIELSDVVLDSPGWNGGNTTIDALTLGKPVVSLPGEFMRGRHGVAFLTQGGVPELIATDEQDYLAKACDPEFLHETIRKVQPEGLYNDPAPAQTIVQLVRKLSKD